MSDIFPGMNDIFPGMNGPFPGMNGLFPGMSDIFPGMNDIFPGMNGLFPGMSGLLFESESFLCKERLSSLPARTVAGRVKSVSHFCKKERLRKTEASPRHTSSPVRYSTIPLNAPVGQGDG
jgi:hypothetical protein